MPSQFSEDKVDGQTNTIDLTELKEALVTVLEQGCEVLKEISEKPIEIGGEVVKKVEENGKKAVAKGAEAVKEHPLVTLLVAFGLGFLVVKLLKRK